MILFKIFAFTASLSLFLFLPLPRKHHAGKLIQTTAFNGTLIRIYPMKIILK